MVNTILSADLRCFTEDLIFICIHEDVRTHCWFSNAERPNVEIMNFDDMLKVQKLFSEIFEFDILGSTFHQDTDAIFNNPDGCECD